MTRLSKYFTHLVDLADLIKDTEKIPERHEKQFEEWLELTRKLHDNLRGFEILDTLPYSRVRKLTGSKEESQ